MKRNKILAIIFIIFILSFFATQLYNFYLEANSKKAVLIAGQKKFTLDIARSETEKRLGLMFKRELCENCGMLFVFDREEEQSFWMKNTYIPLDIIFLSKDFRVNNLYENLKPSPDMTKEEDIEIVRGKAKYVIEINANSAKKAGIKEGEKLKLKFI